MKKRIIWKMFALSVVTLGIYRLYWFIKTRREMMDLNPNIKILSPFFLFLPIILVLASLGVFMINVFQTSSQLPEYCGSTQSGTTTSYDIPSTPRECQYKPSGWGIASLYLSILLFYPLLVIWLWGYSKGVETITGDHLSFAIALIILILVPDGIDILIVQDSFNKLADTPHPNNHSGSPKPIAT